jgi:Phosphotransferase enzyme family
VPLSPIELLLPKGFAGAAIVLGSACPSVLVPLSSSTTSDNEPVDLVVLAPSREERRDRSWIDRAASTAATRLTPNGVAYMVPARATNLTRALHGQGLSSAGTLLHMPDVSHSRHVVPVGSEAERYALSGRLGMNRVKRLAAATAMRASWSAALGPTGAIFRRDPVTPLAAWLFVLAGESAAPGSFLLTTRRAPGKGSVIRRFAQGEREPDAVAKVSSRTSGELRALRDIAPAAARAGARVPAVMWSGELGTTPVLVQTALPGENAARLVARRQLDPVTLQEWIAGWLERWARSAARRRRLGQDDLDRFVLSPAARLVRGDTRYLAYLEGLCARAVGASCPLVPAHGDLTAANVVVNGPDDLGVLDWEEASSEALPLTDFFYAAADVVAAAGSYADRPGSIVSCFASDGDRAQQVRRLDRRLADSLELDPVVREACFHACWLHHAGNEASRETDPTAAPFGSILETVADDPERFRP